VKSTNENKVRKQLKQNGLVSDVHFRVAMSNWHLSRNLKKICIQLLIKTFAGEYSKAKVTFTLIRVRVPSTSWVFTARTSFTRTIEHSWSLVEGQLNVCLPTISSKIESRECFAKKVTLYHYIVNNLTNRAPLTKNN